MPLRPLPRQLLERLARPLLARILAPHSSALAAHALDLAALAASAQTDRALVGQLWHLLSSAPPALVPLADALGVLADVATRAGHEALLARDTDGLLDRELGDEDCAAVAFLDHRPLFDAARPDAGSGQARAFASFTARAPRPLPTDPAHPRRFEELMADALEARGRTRYFRAYERRDGAERHVELVYGRLAAARDLLARAGDGAHDVAAQVTDRTTERAHLVFHDDSLALDVAGPDWMKEVVRRAFGEAYFGASSHFGGDESVTLAPLLDLGRGLSASEVPGLVAVHLYEVWVELDGAWVAAGARSDVLSGPAQQVARRALSEGTPVEATFALVVTGKTRPVRLKLAAPRRVDFDRRDARVVRVARDWMVARGYVKIPEHLRPQRDERAAEIGAWA